MSTAKQLTEAAYQAAYSKIETLLILADEEDKPPLEASLDALVVQDLDAITADIQSRTTLLNSLVAELESLIGQAAGNATLTDALGEFDAILTTTNEALAANGNG